MLLNCSNHPYDSWPVNQKKAAEMYGKVVDFHFPTVGAELSEAEVQMLSNNTVQDILKLKPDYVLCQGEFTLAFSVIKKIRKAGVEVIAACSERSVQNSMDECGNMIKISIFNFVRFRSYV